MSLQVLQAPVDAAIVNAMIESTPESWSEIVLTLARSGGEIGAFRHELVSPEGHPPVGPAESMYEATYRLDELLRAHAGVLSKATYVAKYINESWSYQVSFEYAAAI